MADSLFGFANKCLSLATGLGPEMNRATNAACFVVKTAITTELADAGYASGRLRNMGRSGAPIGARYNVRAFGGHSVGLVYMYSPGAARLVEDGSYKKPEGWDIGPHIIGKRAFSNAKRRGQLLTTFTRSAVLTPDGPFAKVHHPPLHGSHPFLKGVTVGAPFAVKAYQQTLAEAMIKTFAA